MFSLLRGLRSVQLILPGKKVPWEEKDGVGARVSTEVFFFFLELKRYKIFSCLPEIRDAMILFPATRTKTSEALLRSRLEFLLL